MLHSEKSLPPFMMLGSALVTEKDGSATSLFVSSRNTAGMVSVRPFTPRWGRGDVQPCKAAARLLSGGVLPAAVFNKLLQFAIPALRAFVIHDQRAEHAHALHQRGGCKNFRLRQAAVVFFHLGIVPHAGVNVLHYATSSSETLEWSPPLV